MEYDFTSSNQLMPHPIYAWMGWVCILNPTEQKFEELKPLIQEVSIKIRAFIILAVFFFNSKNIHPTFKRIIRIVKYTFAKI